MYHTKSRFEVTLRDLSPRKRLFPNMQLTLRTAHRSLFPNTVNQFKLYSALGILLLVRVAQAATFQIADPVEFAKIINTNSVLATNANIPAWLEGPVWIPNGGYLLFCDQGNNKLKK